MFTLDDLVLPPDVLAKLRELVAHVALRHVVLDDWGFRRRLPRGQGVPALFAGPPGTGKTIAAEALAHALRQDLYRVDLSAVVSKYVGETEKNLASAFDEAERGCAVLFFDEADALFSRRTEVRDAHDRYANLEVNYLLQRVESFTGLVVLATNRGSSIDEAFLRRLRFLIRFELPGADLRRRLWRRSFPPGVARGRARLGSAGPVELAGGSIQAAARLGGVPGGGGRRPDHLRPCGPRPAPRIRQARQGLAGRAARGGGVRKDLRPGSLRVEVAAPPNPFLLRGAIEGHLAGRPVRPGPELAVAEAVRAEIERARETGAERGGLTRGADQRACSRHSTTRCSGDPDRGAVPVQPDRRNPDLPHRGASGHRGGERGRAERRPPAPEDYTIKLELDATDGLERGGPLTTTLGISPRLAALEMLVQPVGSSLLGGLAGGLARWRRRHGARGQAAARVVRLGPVARDPRRLASLTIHETSFDELLNPIHASADLSFTVLRTAIWPRTTTSRARRRTSTRARARSRPSWQLPQMLELR